MGRAPQHTAAGRRILTGVAGWSYPDWTGIVYPARRARDFHELSYLAEYFDTIEINTSFYQPVRPALAEQWIERAAANPQFVFTAKLWQKFTHEPGASRADEQAVRQGFAPLLRAGKLGAVLMQFPHSFRPSAQSWEYFARLAEAITVRPIYVEFRHEGWADPATVERCAAMGIGVVVIDTPTIAGLYPWRSEVAERATWRTYVRLHGRNPDNPTPSTLNHVYAYSDAELRALAESIEPLPRPSGQTLIIFNNDHPRNVIEFQEVLLDGARRDESLRGDAVAA